MEAPVKGEQLQFFEFQYYPVTVLGVPGQAEKCPDSYSDPTKHRWEIATKGLGNWIECLDCVAALQPTIDNFYIYHGGECY